MLYNVIKYELFKNKKIRSIAQPENAKSVTKQITQGYKRKVGQAKQDGEMDANEGRVPFTLKAFILLCTLALCVVCQFSVMHYCHLYLIMCWNLMARSCSVANLKYDHISWGQDLLKIILPIHKGDEIGARSYPKHVYANPLNPVSSRSNTVGTPANCFTQA